MPAEGDNMKDASTLAYPLFKPKAIKNGEGNNGEGSSRYILCSFRTVIGEVLVSAIPGMARKTSPTK